MVIQEKLYDKKNREIERRNSKHDEEFTCFKGVINDQNQEPNMKEIQKICQANNTNERKTRIQKANIWCTVFGHNSDYESKQAEAIN